MKIDMATISAMQSAGISFVVSIRAPWGGSTIGLEATDVPAFLTDRDLFAAKSMGVSKDQYLGWVNTGGTPRCCATTKKGTRCANAAGGTQREIEDWIRLDGGYCVIHGGEGAS